MCADLLHCQGVVGLGLAWSGNSICFEVSCEFPRNVYLSLFVNKESLWDHLEKFVMQVSARLACEMCMYQGNGDV